MSAHIIDSTIYGHLWGTEEMRSLFSDHSRTQAWLDILAALAAAQAELGIIPQRAAREISDNARVELVDIERVATGTRETGHSTLGLIHVLKEILGPEAREWVYYGATVQDVSDTWTGLVMKRTTTVALRDLRAIEAALLDLAEQHRDTVMVGRTHGQPGLPITLGFKTAVWAAEIRRHIDRVVAARPRLAVGQLAGAAGTLSFWGEEALRLQRLFCERLGLGAPDMTWLTARDRIAEFLNLLAIMSGTMAKVGNEIYNLQRPEIGEVKEAFRKGVVGSITMPHKRNPELSEHLVTLARIVRAQAALALEGMVHEHERDGSSWKTEWAFLPEACIVTAAALNFGVELCRSLEVDKVRMMDNLQKQEDYLMSEAVMQMLSSSLGKHTAHEVVYSASMAGVERGQSFRQALADDPRIAEKLVGKRLEELLDPSRALGSAGKLVDRVVSAGRKARAADPQDIG